MNVLDRRWWLVKASDGERVGESFVNYLDAKRARRRLVLALRDKQPDATVDDFHVVDETGFRWS